MGSAVVVLDRLNPIRVLRDTHRVTILIVLCWILAAVCFTSGEGQPGAEAVGVYGLVKAASRILTLLVLGFVLIADGSQPSSYSAIWRLVPMAVFAGWTMVSTLWSPLTTITLTHSVETMMLTLIAMAAGVFCQEERDLSRLLCNLVIIISLVSVVVVTANIRLILVGIRPMILMQPNNIAAVAATGVITMCASRALWGWRWTRTLFLPAMFICGGTVLIARSRSCIIAAAVILVPLLWRLYRNKLIAAVLLIFGILAAAWPFSETVSHLPDTVVNYLMRGQTAEDAYTVSGRTELWSIALDSFQDAPFFGHGYYVMTGTGSMRVWGSDRWQTAHNTYLHVITGTGVIGFALFCWALLFVLGPVTKILISRVPRPPTPQLALFIAVWCLVLGCFELSFAGPVDPMVLLFFIILGFAAREIGQASADANLTHP